jgi:hypothetical protein
MQTKDIGLEAFINVFVSHGGLAVTGVRSDTSINKVIMK